MPSPRTTPDRHQPTPRFPAVLQFGRFQRPAQMPEELARECASWPTLRRSPYSQSFYNTENKDWGFTVEGTLRVSDHWNFRARDGAVHCPTDCPVENRTHWTIAERRGNVWQVLATYRTAAPEECAAVEAARSRAQIEQVRVWRQSDRAILRSLIVGGPATTADLASAVVSGTARAGALVRLAEMGLVLTATRREATWSRQMPRAVERKLAAYPRSKSVHWLEPSLERTARALCMAWDAGQPSLLPSWGASAARKRRRLLAAIGIRFPGLPEEVRSRLDGEEFLRLSPDDDRLLEAHVRRAAAGRAMADLQVNPVLAVPEWKALTRPARIERLRSIALAAIAAPFEVWRGGPSPSP